jgi:hypothetical protein
VGGLLETDVVEWTQRNAEALRMYYHIATYQCAGLHQLLLSMTDKHLKDIAVHVWPEGRLCLTSVSGASEGDICIEELLAEIAPLTFLRSTHPSSIARCLRARGEPARRRARCSPFPAQTCANSSKTSWRACCGRRFREEDAHFARARGTRKKNRIPRDRTNAHFFWGVGCGRQKSRTRLIHR